MRHPSPDPSPFQHFRSPVPMSSELDQHISCADISSLFIPSLASNIATESRSTVSSTSWSWAQSCSTSLEVAGSWRDQEGIILNILTHPELLSPILIRADIISDGDLINNPPHSSVEAKPDDGYVGDFLTFRPIRRLVLRVIPRNPRRDGSSLQSIWIYKEHNSKNACDDDLENRQSFLVTLVPHLQMGMDIPHYLPNARAIAILLAKNKISIHSLLPNQKPVLSQENENSKIKPDNVGLDQSIESQYVSERRERMLNKILEIVKKHIRNPDYVKRVHHDTIISKEKYQTVYQALKAKHAERLCRIMSSSGYDGKGCREVDKLFEELGIASFCICLWEEMYGVEESRLSPETCGSRTRWPPTPFVGFVDIGCGSGVLTDVLIQEGWPGYGFDAKRRKAWGFFDENVQDKLFESTLVPSIVEDFRHFQSKGESEEPLCTKPPQPDWTRDEMLKRCFYKTPGSSEIRHPGIFPAGTFIICNHGDELTAWTPLLASMNECPFLVIPCCSFNLSGKRFRAQPGVHLKGSRQEAKKSVYQSFIAYVEGLCAAVGVSPEKEWLRIPSTRNLALVGRRYFKAAGETNEDAAQRRKASVHEVVQREGAMNVVFTTALREQGGH